MYPSLDSTRADYMLSHAEEQLLTSSAAPIVLLERRLDASSGNGAIAESVAPGNPYVGVMLPYTPLHHLLMRELGFPIVVTSGNRSDEPICIDDGDALQRLGDIADLFLTHNRPIVRPVDDSVARVCLDQPMILRAARGYTPLVISASAQAFALAVGAQQKSSVAVSRPGEILLSQHIGDLETNEARRHFERTVASMLSLHDVSPGHTTADLHPDYDATRYAQSSALPVYPVQHHYAHALACMAEHGLSDPLIAVVWDGTGLGTDGTIWGGEVLQIAQRSFERVAHLRTFRLPGGDAAARDGRRSALSMLYEIYGSNLGGLLHLPAIAALTEQERHVIARMLARGLNCPVTSSAGRLFDALASLTGIAHRSHFEGEAAMQFEFAAMKDGAAEPYEFSVNRALRPFAIDWEPMIRAVVKDIYAGTSAVKIASRCHRTLSAMVTDTITALNERNVVLAGGCFQNRLLLTDTVRRLRDAGHEVYWSQKIPINDGGIAVGQLTAWQREQSREL
jgi:hydrogenase maturation protein HypF